MILEDEKQLIRIISNRRFIIEKSLWLWDVRKILDLAIIISAAIRTLKTISVVDIVSKEEKFDKERLMWFICIRFITEIIVSKNKEAIVTHQ